MKFNVSYPATGVQKCIEIDDDKKCSIFYDKRMGQEVDVEALGDEFKGYVFKITGGNDKQGFPMKQGILVKGRARILMTKGMTCYRVRRVGERVRKTIRGCIVGPDIRVLAVSISKKGAADIPDLTDKPNPRRLGPKRATRIKKLFGLEKSEKSILVRKLAIRRTWNAPNEKARQKAPKIQRLITDARLRRKRVIKKVKKDRWVQSRKNVEEYTKQLKEWKSQKEQKKSAEISKRKASTEAKKQAPKVVKPVDTKKAPQQPSTTQPKTKGKK